MDAGPANHGVIASQKPALPTLILPPFFPLLLTISIFLTLWSDVNWKGHPGTGLMVFHDEFAIGSLF